MLNIVIAAIGAGLLFFSAAGEAFSQYDWQKRFEESKEKVAERIVCTENEPKKTYDFDFDKGDFRIEEPFGNYVLAREWVIERKNFGSWYLILPWEDEVNDDTGRCLGTRDQIECGDRYTKMITYFDSLGDGSSGPFFAYNDAIRGHKKVELHTYSGTCRREIF